MSTTTNLGLFKHDNVSPNVEVTYKKDIETLFANTLVEGV